MRKESVLEAMEENGLKVHAFMYSEEDGSCVELTATDNSPSNRSRRSNRSR